MEASIFSDGTYPRHRPGWFAGDAAWKATHIGRMLERQRLRACTVASR